MRSQPQMVWIFVKRLARLRIDQGHRGHPVGFGSLHYERLRALKGDRGARAIVEDHAADGIEMPFDDAGILLDIDTPQDLVGCLNHMPR